MRGADRGGLISSAIALAAPAVPIGVLPSRAVLWKALVRGSGQRDRGEGTPDRHEFSLRGGGRLGTFLLIG
jgi:hypothetical protein